MRLFAIVLTACVAACDLFAAETARQPPPPNVVIVPLPNAFSVIRHPTLPVLYVGCEGSPESKNLVTFRLESDGSLAAGSQRICDDYLSPDGKKPSFKHRFHRPAVNVEKGILYLAGYPIVDNSSITYSNTNNFEYSAVALDEQGQPAKRLKLFRCDITGQQGLMGIRYLPAFRRLFLTYYTTFSWLELDGTGLPTTEKTQWIHGPHTIWEWLYVREWDRYYANRGGNELAIFQLKAEIPQSTFVQMVTTDRKCPCPSDIEVSPKYHKLYLLDGAPGRELFVHSLDAQGRLLGLPRSFLLGPIAMLRCDFKAGLLYAFTKEALKVFKLDADGSLSGPPQVHPLGYGDINDVCLDETTGKLYVACTKPL